MNQLKIGDRVRYSVYRLDSFRRSHSGFGYMRPDPKRRAAEEALEAISAERGTIVGVKPQGYRVKWDASAKYPNGCESDTIAYYVDSVDSVLFPKASA